MGTKGVMLPEELVKLLNGTTCEPEIQAKIVGDYAHLYGYIEGLEMMSDKKPKPTDKHKHMNHHHELTENQEIIDLGTGKFVADKPMLPLLKALNNIGLRTRSHNYDHATKEHFICICLDNGMNVNIISGHENKSTRENMCETQIVIGWKESK